MAGVWGLVVGAPVVALLLLGYALRPVGGGWAVAPVRLAVIRAGLAVAAYAVLVAEVAGGFDALTRPVVGAAWLAGLGVAAALAAARWRRRGDSPLAAAGRLARRGADAWRDASLPERVMAGALGALLLAEALLALVAEPNNFDSQTYHLPRVEHWISQRDLGFYPTAIHRQITMAPGAEYLLLHPRLLTGGDALHHLVQWAAGVGCLVAASRIAAQLGGSRLAQVITAFVVGTTPMVVLQATSTQNDLVTAAWAASAGTLALDGLTRRMSAGSVLALGAATGLTAITKNSGLLAVGPLLVLWAAGQVRLRAYAATVAAAVGVLAVAAALAGPYVLRVEAEFDHALGPPVLRRSVPMQRHDPASILVNGLRIGHTALDTPIRPVAGVTADAITGLARLAGVDPQDRATTFGGTTFPVAAWYPAEDRAAFPIAGGLALLGVVVAVWRPRRLAAERPGTVRAYAAAVAASGLLYVATVKWQPWGNRLLLFALVLAVPLAGLWLAPVLRRPAGGGRRATVAAGLAGAVLAASAVAGVLTVGYGHPRRLVGPGSALTTDDWSSRFTRHRDWAVQFRWAAAAVDEAGARRLGLVQQNDTWEYPWWLLLRDRHEIVSLQSVLPRHPAPDPDSVDAIICAGDRAVCAGLVPAGWRLAHRGYAGYALPPTR